MQNWFMTLVGTKSIDINSMSYRWIWFKKYDEKKRWFERWNFVAHDDVNCFFETREWIESNYDWLIGLTNQWTINR